VMAGRETQVALALPEPVRPRAKRTRAAAGPSKAHGEALPADPVRIEALREWRRKEAARRAVPAYVVLHDSTLAELASARPSTLEALAGIRGIGPSKLEAYGPALIAIFAADRNA